MTVSVAPSLEHLTLDITEEIHVRSSLTATFAALLEELGPANQANGTPMPLTLEAWPGGRWFRDLGEGNGHFWGHVQAIKRPTLLEVTGPLMMSTPVISNVQYRLKEAAGGTVITLRHTAVGVLPDGYRDGLTQGWKTIFTRLQQRLQDGPTS